MKINSVLIVLLLRYVAICQKGFGNIPILWRSKRSPFSRTCPRVAEHQQSLCPGGIWQSGLQDIQSDDVGGKESIWKNHCRPYTRTRTHTQSFMHELFYLPFSFSLQTPLVSAGKRLSVSLWYDTPQMELWLKDYGIRFNQSLYKQVCQLC